MANSVQILAKIARSAKLAGLTVNSSSSTAVVIENGSNDITVSYTDASISSPMGGVDDSASPFLGIGIANPGSIKLKSAISTADTVADMFDSSVAPQLLHICSAFANDLKLENSDASWELEISGDSERGSMGE